MVNSPFRKSVGPSPYRQEYDDDVESYADTYFREIGYKTGGSSLLGSTASTNVAGDEILDDLDRSLGLLEDSSLATDVERAVAAGGAVSPPRNIGPSRSTGSHKGRTSATQSKSTSGPTFYKPLKIRGKRRSNSDGKSPTDYAISYFRSSSQHDDGSISTLGDGSFIRRVSPKNLGQDAEPKENKAAAKPAPILATPEPIDLKKSRTRSTLEDRPSDDQGDKEVDAHERADSLSSMSSQALRQKWRIIYCTIGIALLLLLAAGAVLAMSFIQLKNDEKNDDVARTDFGTPTWLPRDRVSWSRSPTPAPVEPTASPTIDFLKLAQDDLIRLISSASPDSLSALSSLDTPQFLAYEWMVTDPAYFDYPVERVLQRWSMAVLYFSTGGDMWKEQFDSDVDTGFTPWLEDSNECSWFTTDETDVCGQNGMVVAIHLSNMGLSGSIPPEISLLSNSLERLYLSNNNITGTIPFEIGALSHLVRLQLTSNSIEGTIPSEVAMLTDLRVLGLGRNSMSGRLPEQLGEMKSLKILSLEENEFDGTIPVSFGGMASLELLALQQNELQGFVPVELTFLDQLSSISLHKNKFEGSVPGEFCPFNETLGFLSADCAEVDCECCTHCCVDCEEENGVLTPVALLEGRFDPDDDFFNITDYNTTYFPIDESNITEAPRDEVNITEAPSDEIGETEAPSITEIIEVNETETVPPTNAPELVETLFPASDTDLDNDNETFVPSTAPATETDGPTELPTGLFDILRPILIDQQENETLTDEPSSSPTECESTISIASSCVERNGAGIDVAYSSCNPTARDWFGIFKKDSEIFQVGQTAPDWNDSEVWVRSCGNQNCTRRSFNGTVTVVADRLKEGEYQIILVRRLVVIATIDTVVVEKDCDK